MAALEPAKYTFFPIDSTFILFYLEGINSAKNCFQTLPPHPIPLTDSQTDHPAKPRG